MILNISVIYPWYFSALVFTINFVSIRSDYALAFNRKDNVLVGESLMMKDETKTILKNCAFACPASTTEELKNKSGKSVSKKVLLMNIINKSDSENENELPECDGLIQPSIVFNIDNKRIETGYQIQDEQNIIKSNPSSSKHSILLSLYPSDPKKKPNPKNIISKYLKSYEIPRSQRNAQSSIWLPVLSISFDIETLNPTQVEYKPDSGAHWWRENCNRFDLGKEFYPENSLAFLYSPETQIQLFTGIKKQSTKSSKIQSVTLEEELECGQEFGCLVQHQIIPSYYFHSYYGGLATCTFMNTVPVWKSIVERINLVDKYLYAMIQLWQPNIDLKNQFYDVFKPSSQYFKKIPFPGRGFYLDRRNNNIPVPLILYKVVEYTLKSPFSRMFDRYFAFIVIHNDPTPNSGKIRLCEGDKRAPGWEDIENEDPITGLTYVCKFNKEVLRLDHFPKYGIKKDIITSYDARPEIREKIKQLEKKQL